MNSLQCNHTTHRIRLQDLFVTTFEKLAGVCAGGYPFLSLFPILFFPFLCFKTGCILAKSNRIFHKRGCVIEKNACTLFFQKVREHRLFLVLRGFL